MIASANTRNSARTRRRSPSAAARTLPHSSRLLRRTDDLYDVDSSARISEEIFGPVAAVIPFDTKTTLKIANDTPYGLAAAVWSRDVYRVLRIVKALRAGIVWVNPTQPTYVEAPWGGYKKTGFGRELGVDGLDEYLQTKQVYINLNEEPFGWY